MREGWKYCKLGELCNILDSQRKPITKSQRQNGLIPYYGASGVQDYVDGYIFDGRYLLVGEDGAKWGKDDKSAYIIEGKSWVNNHVHILKINKDVYDSYIEYFLIRSDLSSYITGAVVPKLTQTALVNIQIPIPPIEEQQRIVTELDLLSSIIEKQKTQLKELDTLAQSIFYDMFGDPVTNEKGWEITTIGNCFPYIKNGANIKQDKNADGYPISRIETLSSGKFNRDRLGYANIYSLEKYSDYILNSHDLLVSHINSKSYIGRTVEYISKMNEVIIHGMNLLRLKENANVINSTYYTYYTHDDAYKSSIAKIRKDAVNQSSFSIADFKTIKIYLPPLPLQQQFADKIQSIESQKSAITKSIAETQKLFDYTMDKYFG